MKIKRITALTLLLCLLLSICVLPCTTVSASAEKSAQVYLDNLMEELDLKGVVYVTKNGEVMCQSATGMANTAEGKEITVDTMFPIGSLSKQFCAAAVLLLQEDGKLSVNDEITTYFPDFKNAEGLTIKNLLTHRSGIMNHLIGLYEEEYTLSTDATDKENEQAILEWFYTKKPAFKPDSRYEYSNGNFFLLSLIVEKASGQSYQDFIKENILVPLEMNNSGFYEELYNHPKLAEHQPYCESPMDYELKGLAQGAGDLVSNAKDMDKWMTSLRECTILSAESIAEMTTNHSPNSADGYGYGIGVLKDGTLTHNGAAASYVCVGSTNPENEFNLFVITNDFVKYEKAVLNISSKLTTTFQSIYGDVTGDKKVNVKDATLIQKFAAKYFKFNETETLCADVNNDEKVNIKDATAIQKYSAKIPTDFPIDSLIY